MTRERGNYGPLDRDENFVIGWGTDRLTMSAADRVFGAVVGPVTPILPMIDAARRIPPAAKNLWIGTRGLGGRDEAQQPMAVVGQELFHTVADRSRAITTLSTYFRALANDLATWQAANKEKPDASTSAQWFSADVTPTLEEWRGFVEHQESSWWTKAATSWETYEEWWNRLRTLRALARAHGIMLQSSEPTPLPKTIWQRSAEGKGSQATALLGVLKVAVFGALTITGAVSLYANIRKIRRERSVLIDEKEHR